MHKINRLTIVKLGLTTVELSSDSSQTKKNQLSDD